VCAEKRKKREREAGTKGEQGINTLKWSMHFRKLALLVINAGVTRWLFMITVYE
jgi:hypothetical protein